MPVPGLQLEISLSLLYVKGRGICQMIYLYSDRDSTTLTLTSTLYDQRLKENSQSPHKKLPKVHYLKKVIHSEEVRLGHSTPQ